MVFHASISLTMTIFPEGLPALQKRTVILESGPIRQQTNLQTLRDRVNRVYNLICTRLGVTGSAQLREGAPFECTLSFDLPPTQDLTEAKNEIRFALKEGRFEIREPRKPRIPPAEQKLSQ